MFHALSNITGEGNRALINWVMFIPFFEYCGNVSFLPVIRDLASVQHIIYKKGEISRLSSFKTVGVIESSPAALCGFILESSFSMPKLKVPNSNRQLSIQYYDSIINKLQYENKEVILGTDQNFDYNMIVFTQKIYLKIIFRLVLYQLLPYPLE